MVEALTDYVGIIIVALIVVGGFMGCPKYSMYEKRHENASLIEKSEAEKQVVINKSIGKEEAAKHNANAETIRATGIQQAIAIIDSSMRGKPDSLRYMFIKQNHKTLMEQAIEATVKQYLFEQGYKYGFRKVGKYYSGVNEDQEKMLVFPAVDAEQGYQSSYGSRGEMLDLSEAGDYRPVILHLETSDNTAKFMEAFGI